MPEGKGERSGGRRRRQELEAIEESQIEHGDELVNEAPKKRTSRRRANVASDEDTPASRGRKPKSRRVPDAEPVEATDAGDEVLSIMDRVVPLAPSEPTQEEPETDSSTPEPDRALPELSTTTKAFIQNLRNGWIEPPTEKTPFVRGALRNAGFSNFEINSQELPDLLAKLDNLAGELTFPTPDEAKQIHETVAKRRTINNLLETFDNRINLLSREKQEEADRLIRQAVEDGLDKDTISSLLDQNLPPAPIIDAEVPDASEETPMAYTDEPEDLNPVPDTTVRSWREEEAKQEAQARETVADAVAAARAELNRLPATSPRRAVIEMTMLDGAAAPIKNAMEMAKDILASEVKRGSGLNPLNWGRKVGLKVLEPVWKQKIADQIQKEALDNNAPMATLDVMASVIKISDLRGKMKHLKIDTESTREEAEEQEAAEVIRAKNEDKIESGRKIEYATEEFNRDVMEQVVKPYAISGNLGKEEKKEIQQILSRIVKDHVERDPNGVIAGVFGKESNEYRVISNHFATDIENTIELLRNDYFAHHSSLKNIDEWIAETDTQLEIKLASAHWGSESDSHFGTVDKLLAYAKSAGSGVLSINPQTAGVIAAVGTYAAIRGTGYGIKHIATFVPGIGTAVNFGISFLKSYTEAGSKAAEHATHKTYGDKKPDASLDKLTRNMVSSEFLLNGDEKKDGINQLLELELTNEQEQVALARKAAEIDARLRISRGYKTDLISFESKTRVSQSRLALELAVCKAKERLRTSGFSAEEYFRLTDVYSRDLLHSKKAAEDEFKGQRLKNALVSAGISSISGLAGGFLVKEGLDHLGVNIFSVGREVIKKVPRLKNVWHNGEAHIGGLPFKADEHGNIKVGGGSDLIPDHGYKLNPDGSITAPSTLAGDAQKDFFQSNGYNIERMRGPDATMFRLHEASTSMPLGDQEVVIPADTHWQPNATGGTDLATSDGKILARDVKIVDGKISFEPLAEITQSTEVEKIESTRPVFGPDGIWEKNATEIADRRWHSESSQQVYNYVFTARDGQKGVVFDLSNIAPGHEKAIAITIPGHEDVPIVLTDGADGVLDNKITFDPSDNIDHLSDDPTNMTGAEISGLILNQPELAKLDDGVLGSEVYNRQNVFNIGMDGQAGTIEAGYVSQGGTRFEVFATGHGTGEAPTTIGAEKTREVFKINWNESYQVPTETYTFTPPIEMVPVQATEHENVIIPYFPNRNAKKREEEERQNYWATPPGGPKEPSRPAPIEFRSEPDIPPLAQNNDNWELGGTATIPKPEAHPGIEDILAPATVAEIERSEEEPAQINETLPPEAVIPAEEELPVEFIAEETISPATSVFEQTSDVPPVIVPPANPIPVPQTAIPTVEPQLDEPAQSTPLASSATAPAQDEASVNGPTPVEPSSVREAAEKEPIVINELEQGSIVIRERDGKKFEVVGIQKYSDGTGASINLRAFDGSGARGGDAGAIFSSENWTREIESTSQGEPPPTVESFDNTATAEGAEEAELSKELENTINSLPVSEDDKARIRRNAQSYSAEIERIINAPNVSASRMTRVLNEAIVVAAQKPEELTREAPDSNIKIQVERFVESYYNEADSAEKQAGINIITNIVRRSQTLQSYTIAEGITAQKKAAFEAIVAAATILGDQEDRNEPTTQPIEENAVEQSEEEVPATQTTAPLEFGEDLYELAQESAAKGDISATQLQQELKIDYPTAARLIDRLEEEGIIENRLKWATPAPREPQAVSFESSQPVATDAPVAPKKRNVRQLFGKVLAKVKPTRQPRTERQTSAETEKSGSRPLLLGAGIIAAAMTIAGGSLNNKQPSTTTPPPAAGSRMDILDMPLFNISPKTNERQAPPEAIIAAPPEIVNTTPPIAAVEPAKVAPSWSAAENALYDENGKIRIWPAEDLEGTINLYYKNEANGEWVLYNNIVPVVKVGGEYLSTEAENVRPQRLVVDGPGGTKIARYQYPKLSNGAQFYLDVSLSPDKNETRIALGINDGSAKIEAFSPGNFLGMADMVQTLNTGVETIDAKTIPTPADGPGVMGTFSNPRQLGTDQTVVATGDTLIQTQRLEGAQGFEADETRRHAWMDGQNPARDENWLEAVQVFAENPPKTGAVWTMSVAPKQ